MSRAASLSQQYDKSNLKHNANVQAVMRALVAIAVFSVVMYGFQGVRRERGAGIAEGQLAADFTLKLLKSEKTFKLSSNFGRQPTVLIFGSYT